ncbi:MAG: MazG nucleotide pyrophosphohydrolase domain-containing protein [Chloroflexota bacterium]
MHELHDRQALLGQITETLQSGIQQPALLEMEREIPPLTPEFLQNGSRRLTEFQQFHTALDKAKGFDPDLYINYILLTEEVGELGSEITKVWGIQRKAQEENIGASDAQALALQERQASLKSELADCLAYLLKLANYSGIDLEEAYIEKMIGNIDRAWAHKPGLAHINHQQ